MAWARSLNNLLSFGSKEYLLPDTTHIRVYIRRFPQPKALSLVFLWMVLVTFYYFSFYTHSFTTLFMNGKV